MGMPLAGLRSKTYSKKCFSFVPRGFKIEFQDRKRNDPNRKLKYFSYISLWPKNFFYKRFFICSKRFKKNFKIGNGIIQTGNGIISPTSRPLIEQQNIYKILLCSVTVGKSSRTELALILIITSPTKPTQESRDTA